MIKNPAKEERVEKEKNDLLYLLVSGPGKENPLTCWYEETGNEGEKEHSKTRAKFEIFFLLPDTHQGKKIGPFQKSTERKKRWKRTKET